MIIPIVLIFGVLFVNGFTDAPNSIATAVSCGAIRYKKAVLLCAFFNLFGALAGCLIDASVAEFVASFGNFDSYASYVVCISLFCMIIFGVFMSYFGIPTSESHAMLSAMSGAVFCLSNDVSSLKKLGDVFVFGIFSCFLAFLISFLTIKIFTKKLPYKMLQILSCILNSFMHGYQGGMKYLGVLCFLLSINLGVEKPIFLSLSVGFILSIGTLFCGKKILNLLGNSIIKITDKNAFCSDMGAYLSLFICSILGMPVSTGDIKCLSIMGVGISEKQRINKKTAIKLIISFVAVFPICFILGYFLMKLFV